MNGVKFMQSDPNETLIPTMGINNCGGRCIIYAHVVDGKIVKITTDTSKGSLQHPPLQACVKGFHYAETFLNETTRLTSPLIRTGKRGEGMFRKATWEEAISLITKEWIRIRDTYGPGSRYVHYCWGVSASLTPIAFAKRLLALDGGFLDYYNSYSSACMHFTTPYLFGTKYCGNSYADLLNSKLIILWGHNPADTKFDTHMYFLNEAKKAGIPIICIDPRFHTTARLLQAEWIPIKPGTDACLMDALAYVIITSGLYDKEFLTTFCQGFTPNTMPEGYQDQEDYFSYCLGKRDGISKTPEWAEKITGIPAKTIKELAIRYATTKPAALIQGLGPQRTFHGEQTVRGGVMLACLTGNVGIPGGSAGAGTCITYPNAPSLPKVPNPYPAKIPVYLYTKAIKDGIHMTAQTDGIQGSSQLSTNIKMILNLAGNTLINQHGNIQETAKILQDTSLCEFIVVSDLFMTPSAKFADVVLPSISFLEMNNMTNAWEQGDFIGYNNKVVEPLNGCRFEYDWLKEIAKNLSLYDAFTQGHETTDDWLKDLYKTLQKEDKELPSYETLKKNGIYRFEDLPCQVAFQAQREDFNNHPFPTPSGKIEIFSPALLALGKESEIPAIPKYLPSVEGVEDPLREKYPFQLIGYHTKRRCHSIHDNNPALEAIDPQVVFIQKDDAFALSLSDGEIVKIYNDRGCIEMPVKITNDLCKGVVAISQGAWYTPDENGIDHRGCINVLTSLTPTPLAKGNAQHTNLVNICKL